MSNRNQKTIFITGASSGLGRATAKLFASKGWNVIATMRNPEKETELSQLSGLELLPLDVVGPDRADRAEEDGREGQADRQQQVGAADRRQHPAERSERDAARMVQDARAKAGMDRLWSELSGNQQGASLTLDVKGRKLKVPRAAMGLARFTFAELCEEPLGTLAGRTARAPQEQPRTQHCGSEHAHDVRGK